MSSSAIGSTGSAPQAPLSTQIDYAVAKKALDAQKQEGQAAIQLLEAAAQTGPEHGGSLDVTG